MPEKEINPKMTPAELLSRLLRFDTTNPPGDEFQCVMFIKELLESRGLETMVKAKSQSRPNLLSRIKGRGQAPPLMLYGHVDVVTTKGQPWDKPPFDGIIEDGWVWGRGALDMKSGVAMMVWAFMRAFESGLEPAGDIILAILSDEEKASIFGAKYLTQEYPELFSGVRYAIGEFGGFPLFFNDRRFYAVQVGEKQACGIRVIFRGPAGHGAQPVRDGSMAKLGAFLTSLNNQPFPAKITPVTSMMIQGLAGALPPNQARVLMDLLDPDRTDSTLALLGAQGRLFWPMLHNTVSPTIVHASEKINVIPAEAILDLDVRLLPGCEPEEMVESLRKIAAEDTEFQTLRFEECPGKPDMGLFGLLADILSEMDHSCGSIPYMLSGITDARIFSKLGIQTYGWLPMNLPKGYDFFSSVHGSNERIPVSSVEFGADALYKLIERYNA
jgi:acetylornithine deacetylase/succinyl-diaminopimelate desuccinylase-like protein